MGYAVRSLVDTSLSWASEVRKSPDATEAAIRCVGFTALAASAIAGVSSPFLKNLSGRALANADLINCVQLLPALNFAVCGQYSKANVPILDKVINALFTTIGLSSVVLALSDWKFIDLGRIVATLGNNVAVIKPLTTLSVTVVLRSQLTAAYGCILLSNVKSLCFDNNTYQKKRQILIDIAQFTTQIAFNVLIISGASMASPHIIALGFTGYGLGVASFLHNTLYRGQIAPKVAPSVDEANIPAYVVPTPTPVERAVDFASRLSQKFEGLDTSCKFAVGGIEMFGLFAKVTAPFVNFKSSLSSLIDFNKATALLPRSRSVGHQISQGDISFKKSIVPVCLLAVTIFETLTWYWGMSDLGKAGNLFKFSKNAFFITGLSASVCFEGKAIEGMGLRVTEAMHKVRKWQNRLEIVSTLETVSIYYNAKLANNRDASQEKINKWYKNISQISSNEFDLDAYKNHLAKKNEDWKGIEEYRKELMESASNGRMATSLKVLSLALDVAAIAMTVFSVASVTLPVIGVQFALLARTKQVFTTVNFVLGSVSMKNLYFKEYTVEARKEYLLKARQIDPKKL